MTNLIILGHGGYGTAVKNTLAVLLGETDGVLYIDFNKEDDLQALIEKIDGAVDQCTGDILFACDIAGGSPFRQCAMRCIDRGDRRAAAGLNIAAYAEMVFNLKLPVEELLELALQSARRSIVRFPEKADDPPAGHEG